MAEAGEIVEPVRIDQRVDLRQLRAGLVMVDHDDRHAETFCFGERLDAGGAAIDGDEQRGALCGQRTHGFRVGPVALEDAVGNVDQRIKPAMAQMPGQQRRRGRAVDIVVAEDRDLLAVAAASAIRFAAASISVTVNGSGRSLRMVGSRKSATASLSTPRPASTRASSSGSWWRCTMASALAAPRASSRSRQSLSVSDAPLPGTPGALRRARRWRAAS